MKHFQSFVLIAGLCAASNLFAQAPDAQVRALPPINDVMAQPSSPPNVQFAPIGLPAAWSPAANAPEPIVPGQVDPAAPRQFALADLDSIALANNPTLALANARVQAAQGNWVQVGLYPNPTGGYSTAEIGEVNTAGQQGGMIGQEIVLGGKLKLNRAIAAQEVRQAEQEREAQTMRVLNDVHAQFYAVLIAQDKVTLAERLVGVGNQGVDTTQRLFKAQEVSLADVLQARIEANSARILAENAHNEWPPAQHGGNPGRPALRQAPSWAMFIPAWQRSPGTKPYNESFPAARKLPPRKPLSNVRERPSIGPKPNRSPTSTCKLSASTTIQPAATSSACRRSCPFRFGTATKAASAKPRLNLLLPVAISSEFSSLCSSVWPSVYQRDANARHQVERYQQNILPDAQASLDLVNEAYRQGEYGYLILLTAQRTDFQTNLAYLDALRQLRESTVEIDGFLLRGSLQPGN